MTRVLTNDLFEVVGLVRQRLQTPANHEILHRQELTVRYILVDPILRAIGWNTEDPRLVQVEYNVRDAWSLGPNADYALLNGAGKPQMFIEVKTLGSKLDEAVMQCMKDIEFCTKGNVDGFIVGDGRKYDRYKLLPGQRPQRIVECDVSVGSVSTAVRNLRECFPMPAIEQSARAGQ